jgi:hypothetical protein
MTISLRSTSRLTKPEIEPKLEPLDPEFGTEFWRGDTTGEEIMSTDNTGASDANATSGPAH